MSINSVTDILEAETCTSPEFSKENPENVRVFKDHNGTQVDINKSLSSHAYEETLKIFESCRDVFASNIIEIQKARILPAVIQLTDEEPVNDPPYNLPSTERKQLKDIIDDHKSADIVSDTMSLYASPAFLVKKRSDVPNSQLNAKDKRLVVNYKKLNLKVIPDRYPLPRIDNILTELRGKKYFSRFDFLQGFYQQELSIKSQAYSASTTPHGLFQLKRQPLGIKNGSSSFSRALNRVFADLLWYGVIIYDDDLIIYSDSEAEHLRLLKIVFQRLKEHNLRLKTQKCKVFYNYIDILGFYISENTMSPSEKNLEPILKAKPPKSLKELHSFLGSCTFYRSFIYGFAKICAPLYNLLKLENQPFQLTSEAENAFKTL